MSRYAKRFAEHALQGRKAFIPFTLLGWPNIENSKAIIKTLVDADVSALELGLPFSDPVADGPVIQQAVDEVLAQDFCVDDAIELIRYARSLNEAMPIGLLVYFNMVLARGVETFFADMAAAGVDGVLIADLPPESSLDIAPVAQKHGVDLIFIVSPLTTAQRLEQICQLAGGFLYVVSRLGITGTEERFDTSLQHLIASIHSHSNLPACVGFGVSSAEAATQMLAQGADGVITGSKIIQLVRGRGSQPVKDSLSPFLEQMLTATHHAPASLTATPPRL